MAKYKVAVATNDGVNVNVHFGHAAAFDIYEVDDVSGTFEKVEVRVKPEHCDGSCGDGTCGRQEVEHSSMFAAAKNLADLDYVKKSPSVFRKLRDCRIKLYKFFQKIMKTT